MAAWLLDANVLLRLVLPEDPMLPIAQKAITGLMSSEDKLHITAQNLVEFWAVATRPFGLPSNGLGLAPAEADAELRRIRRMLDLLSDNDQILVEWEKLVVNPGCYGKQAHDARLVAVMLVHGIPNLLTFNEDHFARFTQIRAVNPRNL